MKYILILAFMFAGIGSSSYQTEPILIATTYTYLEPDKGTLYNEYFILPPYFNSAYEVQFKLFERYVLDHDEETLLKHINLIKENQKNN